MLMVQARATEHRMEHRPSFSDRRRDDDRVAVDQSWSTALHEQTLVVALVALFGNCGKDLVPSLRLQGHPALWLVRRR